MIKPERIQTTHGMRETTEGMRHVATTILHLEQVALVGDNLNVALDAELPPELHNLSRARMWRLLYGDLLEKWHTLKANMLKHAVANMDEMKELLRQFEEFERLLTMPVENATEAAQPKPQ